MIPPPLLFPFVTRFKMQLSQQPHSADSLCPLDTTHPIMSYSHSSSTKFFQKMIETIQSPTTPQEMRFKDEFVYEDELDKISDMKPIQKHNYNYRRKSSVPTLASQISSIAESEVSLMSTTSTGHMRRMHRGKSDALSDFNKLSNNLLQMIDSSIKELNEQVLSSNLKPYTILQYVPPPPQPEPSIIPRRKKSSSVGDTSDKLRKKGKIIPLPMLGTPSPPIRSLPSSYSSTTTMPQSRSIAIALIEQRRRQQQGCGKILPLTSFQSFYFPYTPYLNANTTTEYFSTQAPTSTLPPPSSILATKTLQKQPSPCPPPRKQSSYEDKTFQMDEMKLELQDLESSSQLLKALDRASPPSRGSSLKSFLQITPPTFHRMTSSTFKTNNITNPLVAPMRGISSMSSISKTESRRREFIQSFNKVDGTTTILVRRRRPYRSTINSSSSRRINAAMSAKIILLPRRKSSMSIVQGRTN